MMWSALNKEAREEAMSHKSYEQILEEYEKFFNLDEEMIKK